MGKKETKAALAAVPVAKPARKKKQTTSQGFAATYLPYLLANMCQPAVEGQPLKLAMNLTEAVKHLMATFPNEYLTAKSLKGVLIRQNIQQKIQKKPKEPKAKVKAAEPHLHQIEADIAQLREELKQQAAAGKRRSDASNKQTKRIKALEDEIASLKANAVRQEEDHVQLNAIARLVYVKFPELIGELLAAIEKNALFWQEEWTQYAIVAKSGGCTIESLAELLKKKPPEVYLGLTSRLQRLMTADTARWLQKSATAARSKQQAVQQQLDFESDSDAGSQQEPAV